MFTGIVTDLGRVESIEGGEKLRRVRIASAYDPVSIAIGASIACSGPCLTVTSVEPRAGGGALFDVDVAAETLARTTAGDWAAGTQLNLERSLRIGDELGGHIVTGHIDVAAVITDREEVTGGEWGPTVCFTFDVPTAFAQFVAAKGSVTLDGTSLTVNAVQGTIFSVLLIPYTLAATTWGERRPGDRVNLEVDLMARYAARLVEAGRPGY